MLNFLRKEKINQSIIEGIGEFCSNHPTKPDTNHVLADERLYGNWAWTTMLAGTAGEKSHPPQPAISRSPQESPASAIAPCYTGGAHIREEYVEKTTSHTGDQIMPERILRFFR